MPHTFIRPREPRLSVERVDVDATCPKCGSHTVKRYPVLSEGGWWLATKCQDCLHSLERERSGRMGSITVLSDTL